MRSLMGIAGQGTWLCTFACLNKAVRDVQVTFSKGLNRGGLVDVTGRHLDS